MTRLLPSLALFLLWSSPCWSLDLKQQYEEALVQGALKSEGLELEPTPEGKVIERVVIARENIIAPSDPWPLFLNWIHIKTRESVVRQEILIEPGQLWDQDLVNESARNLRQLYVLAVVRAVPCKSPRPGHVVLLVVTKDLWSIRLNTNWSMVGSVVEFVDVLPTEMNFLGRNKRISLHLGLHQFDVGELFSDGSLRFRDRVVLGQIYIDDRVGGSRLRLVEWFDAVLAGDVPCGGSNAAGQPWCPGAAPGELEGFYLQLRLTRPLFALSTRWGFDTYAVADLRQVRRYTTQSGVPELRTVGYTPDSGGNEDVPRVHDKELVAGQANVTRSFGREIKHDVKGGLGVQLQRYQPPDGFSPAVIARYAQDFLPRSEDVGYIVTSYATQSTRFIKLRDVNSYALTEDFLLGHDLELATYFATNFEDPALGYIELQALGLYRWHWADDLLTVVLGASSRWQPRLDRIGQQGSWANTTLSLRLHNVTPKLWIGRLHTQLQGLLRDNNIDRYTSTLGAGNGLRGYQAEAFEGDNLLRVNLEYRSLPINLATVHLGFVLFYDGGTVFGGPDPIEPRREVPAHYYHSLGLGLRLLFPQFDKDSVRLDFGVPLSNGGGSIGTWVSFSFRQVFPPPEDYTPRRYR